MENDSVRIENLKSKWDFDAAVQRYVYATTHCQITLDEIRAQLDPRLVHLIQKADDEGEKKHE